MVHYVGGIKIYVKHNKNNEKVVVHYVKLTNALSFQTWFPKSATYRRQLVNPRHQTPYGQSVEKPGTPLETIMIEILNMIQRSPKVTYTIQYSKGMSRVETAREVHICKNRTT